MTDSPAATALALLALAVQDLHDGERSWTERTGAIARHIEDRKFADAMRDEVTRGRERSDRLRRIAADIAVDPSGAENIWLRAILDDADRDTTMIERGPLLDIALIGAF